jgi:hypothetical protein
MDSQTTADLIAHHCRRRKKKEERFDKMLVMGDGCQGLRVWYMKLDWKGSL